MAYFATPRFEENGRRQLQEIIVQNYNHPSVAMWGIFSLLRGTDKGQLEYVRELNALAKSLDKSRPTVACSNQDGEINFITDLIVWQQNVGWSSGSTEDLTVWQSALSSHWNHLSQAVCFGEGGTYGQQNESYVKRGSSSLHRIPESWQTRFHEGYMKYIDENLFWGVWINTMFDFGSARYRAGVRNTGLVSFDRTQRKDAYYLYRTLWNRRMPTLHIVGKNRRHTHAHVAVLHGLFVGRCTDADRQWRYRRHAPYVAGRFPLGQRRAQRSQRDTRMVGRLRRLDDAYNRQLPKTSAVEVPSHISRSSIDRFGANGMRSENNWK